MIIATVCKSGGDYGARHVRWLAKQVKAVTPSASILCLTDIEHLGDDDIHRVPLVHGLPGWWSKIELMRPSMPRDEDILYVDLDVVIRKDLAPLFRYESSFILRGFKRKAGVNSSVMLLRPDVRKHLWDSWQAARPDYVMKACGRLGDQKFIGDFGGHLMGRWQDAFPGDIISYRTQPDKAADARIVVFHGKPRPWEMKGAKIPIPKLGAR